MTNVIDLELEPELNRGARGQAISTIENLKKLLRIHGIKVRYNLLKKYCEITIPRKSFSLDNRRNASLTEIISICCEHRMPVDQVPAFVKNIADENQYNPVAEWIESSPWDGVSRLDEFYATIKSKNEELKKSLMYRWMIGAVAAIYEPEGVSLSFLLVLQGAQYMGKTKWFKSLVPNEQWRKDGALLDPNNKDSVYTCITHWLVELGELEGTFKRADLAALKAFITLDKDIIRLPYDRDFSEFPRRTAFMASVNDRQYLNDETGNRRFGTIECVDINHTHSIDMQQLWAEMKIHYEDGEKWHLSHDEFETLTNHNEDFGKTDPLYEKILAQYDWGGPITDWKTATAVLDEIIWKKLDKPEATKCTSIILKLNGDQKRRSKDGRLLGLPARKVLI